MIRVLDIGHYSWQALIRHRFRSTMALLSMALGVASVVVLTALGEGARNYVLGEFAFLGKDVLVMLPGKKETTGGLPPLTGTAARDITLEDMDRLIRRSSAIRDFAPLIAGSAEVSYLQRAREILVVGSNSVFADIWQLEFAEGRNIESTNALVDTDECVIGPTVRTQLFGTNTNPIGEWLRVASYRCRIVGVLGGRSDVMGMDISDTVIMPIRMTQQLFNSPGLFRVFLRVDTNYDLNATIDRTVELMKELHQGEEDVTLISPDALLASFDDIMVAMTMGVGAIGVISLLVAGILIMNVTLISVSQRNQEIGLLKALGAGSSDVQKLFLVEALMITALGCVLGLLVGLSLILIAAKSFTSVPFATPIWALVSAVTVAMVFGLLFAWAPARRASQLLPIDALQKKK
jgi:putative ABC transport system permease protein